MLERVYLGDWLYNAGIVCFIKIISHGNEDQISQYVTIEDNYIEFDREKLKGFSEKFFKKALEQFGRYDSLIKDFNDYLNNDEANNTNKEKQLENIKRKLNFSLMKVKLKDRNIPLPDKKNLSNNPEILSETIVKVLEILNSDYKDFLESDTQIYLRNIYGQKSFLNPSCNKDRMKKFKEDFEDKITNEKNKKAKHQCIICDRIAKADTYADTGIGSFIGLNYDSLNQLWNFTSKLPLCDICELIYFCSFAGFLDTSRGKDILYFINHDSSVDDLKKDNYLLQKILDKNNRNNLLLEYFTEYYLKLQDQKSKNINKNISFIELNISNEIMPKVFSLQLSREKSNFLKDHYDLFNHLSKASYKTKDTSKYLLKEIIGQYLMDLLSYNYIYWLIKVYIYSKEGKTNYYHAYFNSFHLQNYLMIITLYNKIIRTGGKPMEDMDKFKKSVWFIHNKGKELTKKLKEQDADNKVSSIVFKLLSALRVGDKNKFMEVIARIYMTYKLDIPTTFVDGFIHTENFYAYGYSFVNGLLATDQKDNKGDHNE